MSTFHYLIAEGVHDVTFLGKVLSVSRGASRVRTTDGLDDPCRAWMKGFKWPIRDQIDRLGVPAPVFFRCPSDVLICLRNAEGIGRIGGTIQDDLDLLSREGAQPDTVGVVLDSDEEPAAKRFHKLKGILEASALAVAPALGAVGEGAPRVGVFALPQPGVTGTLEDVLLAVGDVAYPELAAAARGYVERWSQLAAQEPAVSDWKELRKPAGPKKATVSAMTAVLKPGKAPQASLEDHRWVSHETKHAPHLQPILGFLNALLGPDTRGPSGLAMLFEDQS